MTRLSVSRDLQRNLRKYDRETSVVFFKTKEEFGGLSNMAGGYPLQVNGIDIRSSEALYQACRFPHRSDLQSLVIEQKSPMTAKMKTKPHRNLTRPDWDQVRIEIMRWCLRVKLAQNWLKFSNLLIETGDRPIVEQSRKDDYWGAIPFTDGQTLIGRNALGRLLMELRDVIMKSNEPDVLLIVEPLHILDFRLDNRPIGRVVGSLSIATESVTGVRGPAVETRDDRAEQLDLSFNESSSATVAQVHEGTKLTQSSRVTAFIRPYSKYKIAEVEWMGNVPEHWDVRRLKYLLKERDTRSVDGCGHLLSVSQYTGVTQRKPMGDGDDTDTRAVSLIGYKRVEPNDLVVNIMLAWNGSMGVSQFPGIASPAYCVYHFRENAHPWYFHYLLRSPIYKGRIKAVSTGVVESRLRLYTDDLYSLEGLLPPVPDQSAIVRFLEYIDRHIQRYIHAKQKTPPSPFGRTETSYHSPSRHRPD